jgi:hypothetical protein
MFKLAIVLLFVGSAIAEEVFKWDDVPVAENATQCIFRPEVKKLACRGIGGIVECPAVIEWTFGELPTKFEVFGLRRDIDKSSVTPIENRIYELYPRRLDNETYVNYTVTVEGKSVELYLYYAPTSTHSGLRVTDSKCYVRVNDIVFNRSTAKQVVEIKNGGHVELFGEVLAVEKPAQKRWLGFGFPWLWGMGMWGWGLGWGFPFWG